MIRAGAPERVLAALAAAVVALAAAAAPAAAGEAMALVYARGLGRAAIAAAQPDAAAAIAAARRDCGADCELVAVVAPGACLALAREAGAAFGWARAESEAEARDGAVRFCRRADAGRACPVVASRCLPAPPAPAHYGRAEPVAIADPAHAIVVIFVHGARPPELGPDPCQMDRINAPYGVPAVLHELDGAVVAGRRVVVDGFCPPTRAGPVDPQTGRNGGRLEPRVRETMARAAAYAAMGVPAAQIILAGHSLGGWGALVIERRRPALVGGVIAFAPAAFGVASTRTPATQAYRRQRYAELAAAPRLRALVFGFAGDTYEPAEELASLAAVPGVEFVAFPAAGPPGHRCGGAAHARLREPCFIDTQGARIRAFIAARVAGAAKPQ